ncbi:AAA family ATPase [candidate division KSB1 bacterium]|nr:AAA family ATPase [candidate division KSB1 bacterium]
MAIKKIRVSNFKSFKNMEVELSNFNVLIGSNASGKSNFVQIFRFIRNIINHGLDNAISMDAGSVEYLRNLKIGREENLELHISSDEKFGWFGSRTKKKGTIGIRTLEVLYDFAIAFNRNDNGFYIAHDELIHKCEFVMFEEQQKDFQENEAIGTGKIIYSRANGKFQIEIITEPQDIPLSRDDLFPSFFLDEKLEPKISLLQTPFFLIPPMRDIFKNIAIYDFDPKLPKKATSITGKAELEEDGNNLAIVLKNILDDKEKKRTLFNLVQNLLPFIKNLDVENYSDKSLLFNLQEKYSEKHFLPASLISDGTVNITALIVALYFEMKQMTVIEEPERNLHPYLIAKLIEMMKDASKHKQIIVTTHNPEVVKHAGLENILFVSRDKDGFSTISKPGDQEEVKTFLKNEIGIEELFVQNLLGI